MRDVNVQRDYQGLTYARKAMIMTSMAFNTNGLWEEGHVSARFQGIIKKHRNHFDSKTVGGVDKQE